MVLKKIYLEYYLQVVLLDSDSSGCHRTARQGLDRSFFIVGENLPEAQEMRSVHYETRRLQKVAAVYGPSISAA